MRSGRTRRLLLRAFLGVALAGAAVVTPVSPGDLPGELQHLAPEAPVTAQPPPPPQGVVAGTADGCPETVIQLQTGLKTHLSWTDVDANCVLETDACPPSPVTVNGFLVPSIDNSASELDINGQPISRYPGLCEERIYETLNSGATGLDPATSAAYGHCNGATGFVVMTHDMEPAVDGSGNPVLDLSGNQIILRMCRMIHPLECIAGLHRTGSNQCRAVRRATWTCTPPSIPRNEFNTCYTEPPSSSVARDLACGTGSPAFVAQSCEDYVANDFVHPPGSVDCAVDFNTGGSTSMSTNSSNTYWCVFDPAYLKVVCHGAAPRPAECSAGAMALCLKRASRTGGCNAIAETIRCREQQAAYRAGGGTTPTVEQVRAAGCEPCIVLPFQAVPANCPRDIRARPTDTQPDPNLGLHDQQVYRSAADLLHEVKQGLLWRHRHCLSARTAAGRGEAVDLNARANTGCRDEPTCDGSPDVGLVWKSTHHSNHAIVNAPVILTFTSGSVGASIFHSSNWNAQHPNSQYHRLNYAAWNLGAFADGEAVLGDALVRLWPQLDSGSQYGNVTAWLGSAGTGTCVVHTRWTPVFRVTLQELYPDVPAQQAEIQRLFGSGSLDWWGPLSTSEKERHIESRGELTFWDELTTQADRDAELAQRADLDEEISCNVGTQVWCRWSPTRPGYFKVTGAGAWFTVQYDAAGWHDPAVVTDITNALGSTPRQAWVQNLGRAHRSGGIHPAPLGLSAPVDRHPTALPQPGGDEWLYTADAGQQHRCPALDVRVDCGSGGPWAGVYESGVYTETDPVGIQVYWIRVATRRPNT